MILGCICSRERFCTDRSGGSYPGFWYRRRAVFWKSSLCWCFTILSVLRWRGPGEHSAIMYISFRVFYLRYWERLCCTSCMARGQISWVDISVRIISTSQFSCYLLQAIRIWNFCCISSFRIKIKWMGLVYGVYILYQLATGNPASRIVIISSLLNFVVFFFIQQEFKTVYTKRTGAQSKISDNRQDRIWLMQMVQNTVVLSVGERELDDSSLEFRFCSKCNGNYEYCQDHLFTHQHVK